MNVIHIDGDELIPDEAYAEEVHCSRRTLARYDKEPDGLPFILIANKKYRPRKACGTWWARRVKHPNPRRVA